jgi:hypothetical protein
LTRGLARVVLAAFAGFASYGPDSPPPAFGALGHLVNAVDWAASGRGLGIVSLVAAEYPGSQWWLEPDSFLRAELEGHITIFSEKKMKRENTPSIPKEAQRFPLNYRLTSKGLSNWQNSFHAGFSRPIPGYTAIVESTLYPQLALAIATTKFAASGANGPPSTEESVPARR